MDKEQNQPTESQKREDRYRYLITRFKDEFGEEFLFDLANRAVVEIYSSMSLSKLDKLNDIRMIQEECLKYTRPILAAMKPTEQERG